MAKAHSLAASTDWTRIVGVWTWADGSQCLLTVVDSLLELRIEKEGVVLRRARCANVPQAVDMAQRWHVEHEIDCASDELMDPGGRCPGCGDMPLVEVDPESGVHWLRCPSCGNVWLAARNC
jgi:formate dehydrogenase maturation protein FdhE